MAGTKVAKKARLSPALRDDLRRQLVDERATVSSLYKHDLEISHPADEGAEDLVDLANRSFSQDLLLALSDGERELVRQIDEALTRFDSGTFGVCDYCEEPIAVPRLKAVPWARYCIDCQERDENGMLDA